MQVYVTYQFDSEADFQVDYTQVLEIPGNPESMDVPHSLDGNLSARYVIFERLK